MKIIVPMTGLGSRFKEAGYDTYKALINMHGQPVLQYIVEMYPDEADFVFICRNEMLQNSDLEQVLLRIKPSAKIVGIEPHKLGPVYTVAQVFDLIDDNEQVICNYCDFYMEWDYNHFKGVSKSRKYAGIIPCYTGFHPHLLHEKNLYAGCQVDSNLMLTEIKEKYSFESDKFKGYHSAGNYYFDKGIYIKKYFKQLMDEDIHLNGEYYISLVYNLLVKDGLDVLVYDQIPHFCQWGTPEDMEEYNRWSDVFKLLSHD